MTAVVMPVLVAEQVLLSTFTVTVWLLVSALVAYVRVALAACTDVVPTKNSYVAPLTAPAVKVTDSHAQIVLSASLLVSVALGVAGWGATLRLVAGDTQPLLFLAVTLYVVLANRPENTPLVLL